MSTLNTTVGNRTVTTSLSEFFGHREIEAMGQLKLDGLEVILEDIHAARVELAGLDSEHKDAAEVWLSQQGIVELNKLAGRIRRAIRETSPEIVEYRAQLATYSEAELLEFSSKIFGENQD